MLLRLLRRSFGAGGQGDRGAAGRRVPLALPLVFVTIFLTARALRPLASFSPKCFNAADNTVYRKHGSWGH